MDIHPWTKYEVGEGFATRSGCSAPGRRLS